LSFAGAHKKPYACADGDRDQKECPPEESSTFACQSSPTFPFPIAH